MKAITGQFEPMKTHGPLVTNIALWFAMLSPLIGLVIAILGALFFRLLNG
jgi:hypothetical protein